MDGKGFLLGISILTVIYLFVLNHIGIQPYNTSLMDYLIRLPNISRIGIKNDDLVQRAKYPEIKRFLLVVGILSKLDDFERRRAIRLTWKKICLENKDIVVCNFFTDSLHSANEKIKLKLNDEINNHKDIVFMPYKGGHNFALRLVWMMNWYSQYSYNYFLRIDDDYFLCLDRLLNELPYRPKQGLYWGYIHCRENIVRVDEGWLILSRDIVDEVLSKQNTTLQCHPFGDQAVAIWIMESKIDVTYFLDNDRIIHAATAYRFDEFFKLDNCQNYLALHGSYPIQMLSYWILSTTFKKTDSKDYKISNIPLFNNVCGYSKNFIWQSFGPGYRFEPKLCHTSPVWDITEVEFIGRERNGQEASY